MPVFAVKPPTSAATVEGVETNGLASRVRIGADPRRMATMPYRHHVFWGIPGSHHFPLKMERNTFIDSLISTDRVRRCLEE
jgi:hypothetical protein